MTISPVQILYGTDWICQHKRWAGSEGSTGPLFPKWLIGEAEDVMYLHYALTGDRLQAKRLLAQHSGLDERDLVYSSEQRLEPITGSSEGLSNSQLIHSDWRVVPEDQMGGHLFWRFELPGYPYLTTDPDPDQMGVPMGRVLGVSVE